MQCNRGGLRALFFNLLQLCLCCQSYDKIGKDGRLKNNTLEMICLDGILKWCKWVFILVSILRVKTQLDSFWQGLQIDSS